MQITILKRASQNKKLYYYSIEWGKEKGERIVTCIFTYKRHINEIQRHQNNESLAILETKRAQMILNQQASNSRYFVQHKLKSNFLNYYEAFVKSNRKYGNRHLMNTPCLNYEVKKASCFLFTPDCAGLMLNHCEEAIKKSPI